MGRWGKQRDDFVDVAFWKADVYTHDGKANIAFTLPDNLTTWVIDVIGISASTHLGTASKEIIVDKPLKLQSYLPQYLTLGDEITIPVITAGWKGDAHTDLALSGTLSFGKKTKILSFTPDSDDREKRYTVLNLPMDERDMSELKLTLEVHDEDGKIFDKIVKKIPVRKDGFVQQYRSLGLGEKGSLVHTGSVDILW